MPGNEIPENIHNFFDHDNNSRGRQSQVGGGGWPILNNNPWVGIQRQNGGQLAFNSRNHTSQSSDSEQGNGLQPTQTPSGSNPSQKAELVRSQPRNQQLNLNGYMHGSQGLQARPIQAEFQGDGGVSDGHNNLMQRGFSSFQSPQNSSSGYNSALTRSSERPEATEAPVNFDFLGDQQLMRSQHPGISQPRPIQPQGINDRQLWQQHLLYEQLKEMQRQQQLMQLHQGVRQQNSLSQLSDVGRQASSNDIPAVLSGMPINNASNNTWSSELVGGDLRLPSSSPMFLSGNMNWVQRPSMQGTPNGLMFLRDQGQAVRTIGLPPQQPDESLYGTPVACTRGAPNHQSQFQGTHGTTHDISSMQVDIRAGVNQTEESSMHSSAFNCFRSDQSAVPGQGYLQDGVSLTKQGFKEKRLLQNATVQGASSGATSENFQHVNHVSPSVQVQEMSGMLCEKTGEQVTPSRVIATLDPTEVKLLFSTDDGNQDPSFGVNSDRSTGGNCHGNLMQSDNYFSSFPTVNSGSWSALMQEAVEASSSDTGLNEEWSGLSFQKAELSSGNHSAMLQDNNGNQQAWHGRNLQNASSLTSRPFPLFNDANASSNCHATPNFQQPMNFSLQQPERISADAFQESFQHSSKEAVSKPFDHIHHQPKQLDRGSIQTQTQFNNIPNGVWAGQTPEESANSAHSSEAEFNPHNMQHSRAHQQKVSLKNHSDNKLNGWSAHSSAPMRGNASHLYDNDDKRQHVQGKDTERTMNMETDHNGSMWKVAGIGTATDIPSSAGRREAVGSDTGSPMMRNEDSRTVNLSAIMNSNSLNLNQETNQQVLSRHQVDYGKHVGVDAFFQNKKEVTAKYQNQLTGSPQTWDSSLYNTDRKSGESCAYKQENNHPEDDTSEGFISTNSQPGQNTEDGGSGGENSLLARNESQSLADSSLKSSAQSGQRNMGPRRFQFHPMGNLEMSRESIVPQRHNLYSQGLSQSAAQGLRNQERGYIGHSQFAGHALNNALDVGKGHLTDLHRNAKAAEEIQYSGAISNDSPTPSFNGSTSQFPENKRAGLSSQNMLELLHKVDQSRIGKTVERFGFSEQNSPSGRHKADNFDGSSSHLQRSQSSSFQSFGLKLAPPSQRQSVADHALPPQASLQAVNDFNQRNLDSGVRGEDQSRPPSSTSVQSVPSDDDMAQKENQGDKSFPSGHKNNAMYSNLQGNPLAAATYSLRMNQSLLQQRQQQQQLQWKQLQEQRQRFSSASISRPNDQSPHIHQVGVDAKQFSDRGKRQESHDGAMLNQSSAALMPSPAGRLSASRLTLSTDTCASAASKFYAANTGHSQPRNAGSDERSSGQQIPSVERSVAHPSATPAVPQQGGFSTMLHNVWTSVSSQQRLSGLQPQKIISNVLQSRSLLPGGRESLQAPQKPDNHNKRKGESALSEFGACSTNSQQSTYSEDRSLKDNASQQMPPPDRVDADPKTGSVPRGPMTEPVAKDLSDGYPAISILPSVRLHQQDLSKGKCVQDSVIDSHKGQVSLSSIASSGASVHSVESLDVQKQNNYSLLQQMQMMKGTDSDPTGRAVKRLKGADFGTDNSQMDWATRQRYVYGQNTVFREKDATSQNISFPADVRMLSFSARDNKETSASTPMPKIVREVPSQDLLTYKQHDLQNHSHPLSKTPTAAFAGGNERPQISPQMAPSWFEKYGNYKNGQTLTTHDGLGSFQRNANAFGKNYVFSKVSEGMVHPIVPEQKDDASLVGSLQQSTSPSIVESNNAAPSPGHLPLEVTDNTMILIRKKRKSATSDLLPWHKEVTQGSRTLKSISIMEQEWAWASNRLIEKLEEETEMIEDGMGRSRRRLIFTTQLMQQILSSVPATYLHADAAASHESVIYLMAKLILGDACSLTSCSGSHADLGSGNMISGNLDVSEKEGHNHFSRFVEDFNGRLKKLENDFLRLDRRASLLDVRLECQDLERNSIMNRFAKFHGRSQSEGVEGSSMSEAAPHQSFPQRHVTAHALPRNLPEGVICLSL